jgi:purine-cytosine permease-like protein
LAAILLGHLIGGVLMYLAGIIGAQYGKKFYGNRENGFW